MSLEKNELLKTQDSNLKTNIVPRTGFEPRKHCFRNRGAIYEPGKGSGIASP